MLEKATVQYETSRRNVWLKWMVYHYQNWQIAQKKTEQLRKQQISAGEMLSRYETAEQSVKIAMDMASQLRADAKAQYEDNDLTGSIRSLKEQVEKLNEQFNSCEEKQREVQVLQEQINSLLMNPLLGIIPSDEAVAKGLTDSNIGAEDKYRELQDIQAKVNVQKNAFSRKKWEFEEELQKMEEKLAVIERDIQGLENHQRAYPEYVEFARRILQCELSVQGIDTPVRTLAELVEDITLPQWRDALESYLGNRRFHLLVDPQFTGTVMEIFHRHHIRHAQLVMTDKLPEYTPDRGSAAEILNIPNPSARRYVNYLLGRIHLCENLEELHSYPLGGLMTDGTLAKSYSMRMLDMQGIHYYLGADSIALEIEVKKKEQQELKQKIGELSEQIDDYKVRLDKLSNLRLDGGLYEFAAVEVLPKLKIDIRESRRRIEEMEEDPNLMMLGEALERADRAYQLAASQYRKACSETERCRNELKELEKSIPTAKDREKESEDDFRSFALQHLELKREAVAEYEKQSVKRMDGIVITEKHITSHLESRLKDDLNRMENEQLRYCQLAGLDMEMRGSAFISYFRQKYTETSNIQAEEAHTKLEEMQKQLESAFMTECVSELIEAIHNAQREVDAINTELKTLPFGDDIYTFTMKPKADKEAFFRIMKKVDAQSFGADAFLAANVGNPELEHDIREFMGRILQDCDDTELTDYRNYMQYDMDITNKKDKRETSVLSEKQGSASNGEKQTPYFIILAASLMQCYPRSACCARLVFIDEAFSALSSERIERMVQYFEQNGFQVMYAAPPEKINTIGRYIHSTVSLVEVGRYTYAVEGLADEFAGLINQQMADENAQLAFATV